MRTTIAASILLLSVSLVACSETSTNGKARASTDTVAVSPPEHVHTYTLAARPSTEVLLINGTTLNNVDVIDSEGPIYYTSEAQQKEVLLNEVERTLAGEPERWRSYISNTANFNNDPPTAKAIASSSGGLSRTCDCDPEAGPVDCYADEG